MLWLPALTIAVLPAAETVPLGARLPLVALLPFMLLLGSIAVLPLVAEHWWESNRNKGLVSAAIAMPFGLWFVNAFGAEAAHEISHSVLDYLAFMALLGSLFVISGGIHVKGSLSGTPLANSALLALGAVLANLIGTTGASMVLIRPFLRANEGRWLHPVPRVSPPDPRVAAARDGPRASARQSPSARAIHRPRRKAAAPSA